MSQPDISPVEPHIARHMDNVLRHTLLPLCLGLENYMHALTMDTRPFSLCISLLTTLGLVKTRPSKNLLKQPRDITMDSGVKDRSFIGWSVLQCLWVLASSCYEFCYEVMVVYSFNQVYSYVEQTDYWGM